MSQWTQQRVRDVVGPASAHLPTLWVAATVEKLNRLCALIVGGGFNPEQAGLGVLAVSVDPRVANAAVHIPSLTGALASVASKRMAIRREYKRADPHRYVEALEAFVALLTLPEGECAIRAGR